MADTQTAAEAEATYILEEPRRLSQSKIWQIQRNFFEQKGNAAWGEGIVPSYITSNPFIANAYARVVLGFLRDWFTGGPDDSGRTPLDLTQPVYIVELGAGAGRFAFNFLRQFFDLLARSTLQDLPVKYILTDLAAKNLDFWSTHPSLGPFFAAGQLDYALFDAEQPAPLELWHSGEVLAPGAVKNPVVLLANYFFDSIPQDAFYVENGQLNESLLKLASTQPEPDLSDPELIRRVTLIYHREPVTTDYYDDPRFNRLLDYYRRSLNETALDFPSAALECIRFFRELSDDRLLLLSGDKGYDRAEDLNQRQEPGYAVHGSFSMMVNYHAIGQYFLDQGGMVLQTSYRYGGLNILGFLLGSQLGGYVEARQAFYEAVEKQGPDDWFNLTQGLEPHLAALKPEQLLSYLRLSGWDSYLLLKCFPALLEQAGSADEQFKAELRQAIPLLRDSYYYIGEDQDVLFDLGMLLDKIGGHAKALDYFDQSLRLFGPAPSTYFNQAVCYYRLKQLDRALEATRQALMLNPEFEQAQKLLKTIQVEILRAKG